VSYFVRQTLLLLSSIILFYSLIWHQANKEVLQSVYYSAFGYGLFCTAVQILILFVLTKKKLYKTSILLVSIFITFNFIFYVESFSKEFIQSSLEVQIIFICLLQILSVFIIALIHKNTKAYYFIQSFIVVGFLVSIYSNSTNITGIKYGDVLNKKLESWKEIKFINKPNIYVVIYDSLIPKKTSIMFLEHEPEYYEIVNKYDGLIFENSFTQRIPTRPSLKMFMGLGSDDYDYGMITGLYDSPISTLFRNNDYSIITGTRQGYGIAAKNGAAGGDYVDKYFYDNQERFSVSPICLNLPRNGIFSYVERFYFFCSTFKKVFEMSDQTREGWPLQVLRIIDDISKKETPIISILYLFDPIGHTSVEYNVNNAIMKDEYLKYFKNGASYAAQHLDKLITQIISNDPESFILIWGDHGTFAGEGGYKNSQMEILDRYQVFTALIGDKNICAQPEYFNDSGLEVTSPVKVMRSIISCISEEKTIDKSLFDDRENHFFEVFKKYGVRIKDIVNN
jgi:hypothetical protein